MLEQIQVPITASFFFAAHTTLYLIKIRRAALEGKDEVRWDDPPDDNDGCPHLYGNFGAAEVDSVQGFERRVGGEGEGQGQGQSWEEVFAKSAWLE